MLLRDENEVQSGLAFRGGRFSFHVQMEGSYEGTLERSEALLGRLIWYTLLDL